MYWEEKRRAGKRHDFIQKWLHDASVVALNMFYKIQL